MISKTKVGLKRKRQRQYSRRASLKGPLGTPSGGNGSRAKVSNGKMGNRSRARCPNRPLPPRLVPACRASKLRWWSPPLHTSCGISALSGVCGPGGTRNVKKAFRGRFSVAWWDVVGASEEAAHLPASGVGLHHGGGALDLLVLRLLLRESRKSDGQKRKWFSYKLLTS